MTAPSPNAGERDRYLKKALNNGIGIVTIVDEVFTLRAQLATEQEKYHHVAMSRDASVKALKQAHEQLAEKDLIITVATSAAIEIKGENENLKLHLAEKEKDRQLLFETLKLQQRNDAKIIDALSNKLEAIRKQTVDGRALIQEIKTIANDHPDDCLSFEGFEDCYVKVLKIIARHEKGGNG